MRAPLDCHLAPERVLLALRHEPSPFALVGDWAGGGAIVGSRPTRFADDPFDALDRLPEPVTGVEVGGGWFGWLGYRLGGRIERLPPSPPRPVPMPEAQLAFYDHVLRQDAEGRWWFEALRDLPARLAEIEALLARAPEPEAPRPMHFTLHGAGHTAIVRDCVERIAAGELFQANLCLRLEASWDGDVTELFAAGVSRLRPAYGACFPGVASFSPELFLRRRGRTVVTGPIKGTAASDPEALQRSLKDRAEHVMIVDLMRNDLGRVARYGSVSAQPAPTALPHPGGWHLVSEVAADVDATNAALLRATFPPGSVTGAPKVQAMKVIAALEATGREVYTGAIGFSSPNAGLELNVAIRTFEARDGRLWLGAGGGIVADSDPAAELEECLVKARPLVAAIGGRIVHQSAPAVTFKAPLATGRRPDPARGVFETLLVRDGEPVNLAAHLERLAASVRALYGETLPELEIPRVDGAVRIDYEPGRPPRVTHRPLAPRALPILVRAHTLPGGLGAHKWRDRDLLEALDDGTTPLLLDADGTLLEAAWGAVLIRRAGRLYTPRTDGRILPSTSRPHAEEADLHLQSGDELLLSSSLAGLVPATVT